MPSRKDTAEFIAEARAVHGDRYDYSKVVYVEYRKRVEIICPVHGSFWQTPALHVKGRNCRKCAQQKRTEGVAVYCRFCGVRVMYADAGKRRCQSAKCHAMHRLEKNRQTGDVWADKMRKWLSYEKEKQEANCKSGWERKIANFNQRIFAWKNIKPIESEPTKPKEPIVNSWDDAITRARYAAVKESKYQQLDQWQIKIIRFCRESSQGRRNMESRKGSISRIALRKKLEEQGYRCALSGLELSPDTTQIDHKIPVRSGGKTDLENLHFVESKINRMKGALSVDEFVELCLMVVKHTLHDNPLPLPVLGSSER